MFQKRNDNNKIYYNTDNVGIGTDNPRSKLHVEGDLMLKSNIWHRSSDDRERVLYGHNSTSYYRSGHNSGHLFEFRNQNDQARFIVKEDGNIWTSKYGDFVPSMFQKRNDNNKIYYNIDNVGIGTDNPLSKLIKIIHLHFI
jgi:hypothetical protein